MNGKVTYTSICGPLTQKRFPFGIYLPAGYERESGRRYPVCYFLHGLNEDYTSNIETLVGSFESSFEKGFIDPMLVVAPDGYGNSMWVDSKNGKKPAETRVIRELIPYIDATCRTVPDREQRIIAGFSMGGFGACRYALNYPELFSICISMDGAMHNLQSVKKFRGPIFEEIFENDSDYFRLHCLYENAKQKRDLVRGTVLFHVLVGMLSSFNQLFRSHMNHLGIPITDEHFIQTGCGHDIACILEREGPNLFNMLGKRLQK